MRTNPNVLFTNSFSETEVGYPEKPLKKGIKPLFKIYAKSIKEDTRDGDSP